MFANAMPSVKRILLGFMPGALRAQKTRAKQAASFSRFHPWYYTHTDSINSGPHWA